MGMLDIFKPKKKEESHALSQENILRLNTVVNSIRSAVFTGGYDNADTMHHIYEDFGYPETVEFSHLWNMYRRFGVAKAVVEILVDLTWVDPPTIKSESDSFSEDFKTLAEQSHLWNRMKGLDKRQRVGRYAGLFIQIADNKMPDKPVGMLSGVKSIVKLVPMFEGQLQVSTTEDDIRKRNFGEPTMYHFNAATTGSRNERSAAAFSIHPSRLVMAAEGADDGSIYGTSSLESIYNDLMDLRKISGAGGEGFYQNTRNAPIFKADDDFADEDNEEALADAIDEWLGKHRKRLVLKGIEAKFPNIQLSDPGEFYQNSINNISAGSGIPSAFLIGQQTGRLASDKDSRHLMTIAQSRRDNFLTLLVRSFVDWCIEYKVLPDEEYKVEWGDLLTLSSQEKIETSEKMASVNEKQFRSGGQPVFSEEEMRERAGFSIETIDMPDERILEPVEAQPAAGANENPQSTPE